MQPKSLPELWNPESYYFLCFATEQVAKRGKFSLTAFQIIWFSPMSPQNCGQIFITWDCFKLFYVSRVVVLLKKVPVGTFNSCNCRTNQICNTLNISLSYKKLAKSGWPKYLTSLLNFAYLSWGGEKSCLSNSNKDLFMH